MTLTTTIRIALLAATLASGTAMAASPVAGEFGNVLPTTNDELRRLQDMSDDERLERLEKLQNASASYQASLVQQIQQLQNQVMVLEGQLEEAQFKVEQLEKRAVQAPQPQPSFGTVPPGAASSDGEMPIDANQPLPQGAIAPYSTETAGQNGMGTGFGGAVATTQPGTAGLPPAQADLPGARSAAGAALTPPNPNELPDLDKAFQLVRGKQYDAAVKAYSQFIANYPNSSNTPTAHYWLGQVYFAKRDYGNAEKQFQTVVQRYDGHDKTDESLLKLAYIEQSKGNNAKAKQLYKDVMSRFPGRPSAQLAGKRLTQLN